MNVFIGEKDVNLGGGGQRIVRYGLDCVSLKFM